MMVGMKYFLSCVFINFYVIFTMTKTTICHAGGSTGVNQRETPRRNFTTQKAETLTHYGKQFVLGFINPASHNSHETTGKLEIVIQARENNTRVRVSMPYTTFNKTYILSRKEVTKIEIPRQLSMSGKPKVETKGVGITADKDIAVYAFSKVRSNGHQGDGFVVHPKRSLGREYVVTSYAGSHSNIGIVGVEENTTVSILLNGGPRLTYNRRVYKSRDTMSITLNELQTFHIRSRYDLSGVRIIANKPVVVFSGSSCELSKSSANCGFVIDQLPSVKTWGQHYVVYSEQSDSMQGGLVRVTSGATNTVVYLENGVTTNIRGIGGVMDLVVKPRLPTLISCTPFCMATLYKTQISLNKLQSGPSAIVLPATDQFLPHYSVHIPKDKHELAFLNILIKCSAAAGLEMNGVLLTGLIWRASHHERRTWCGATVKVAKPGVNTLHHQDGRTSFGVLVNGIGDQHSYSYFGGRSFQAIRKIGLKKTKPTHALKLAKIVGSAKNTPNTEVYKFTTAGLGALVGVMLLSLVVYFVLRCKSSKNAGENDAVKDTDGKLPDERTYQSIRGFPRRNTHSYEEVKLPLKQSSPHPAIADILYPDGKGEDYENLKFHHEKERDNNTYVPMNEALSSSVMAEQLLAMPDDSDIYLTMKKLIIREPQKTEQTTPEETLENTVILL